MAAMNGVLDRQAKSSCVRNNLLSDAVRHGRADEPQWWTVERCTTGPADYKTAGQAPLNRSMLVLVVVREYDPD